MRVRFTKMHGAGNDFVVFDASRDPSAEGFDLFDPQLLGRDVLRRLADRRRGIGCDQILVLGPAARDDATVAYRVFNADGEQVPQCGNGVRCLARFLADRDGVGEWRLQSEAGVVEAHVEEDGSVAVSMGEPDFDPRAVPFDGAADGDPHTVDAGGRQWQIGVVSMGNPHAVLQFEDLADAPVAEVGAALARHRRFPLGANVGFAALAGRDRLRLRVYERGVGETPACGTGACAAVAVLRRRGALDEQVRVDLPGGQLMVRWPGPGAALWLRGPAVRVYEGHIDL